MKFKMDYRPSRVKRWLLAHVWVMVLIVGLLGAALVIWITGCCPLATDCRKVGFREMQRGFALLERPPELNETIEIKNVKVRIVGDRKLFKWDRAAAHGSPVLGYANRKNEIWVFGARVNGKIVLNQAILGHEFNHLLNFADPRVANPDQLDDLGA